MFACITGRAMKSSTIPVVKSWMTIQDYEPGQQPDPGQEPDPPGPGQPPPRQALTYGGYLLQHHRPNTQECPETVYEATHPDGPTHEYYRERADWDLITLVAQCLCEDPKDRPSMEKLLKFTKYWLRYYNDPAHCNDDQTNGMLGPRGDTSTQLFVGPVDIENDRSRDSTNDDYELENVRFPFSSAAANSILPPLLAML